MKTIKFIISGKVQGVSYRRFARKEAEILGLSGYARNMENGTVEIIVQGQEEQTDKFKERAIIGPPLSSVTSISEELLDNNVEFSHFTVL